MRKIPQKFKHRSVGDLFKIWKIYNEKRKKVQQHFRQEDPDFITVKEREVIIDILFMKLGDFYDLAS